MKYSASEPERQVVYAYADDIKAKDAEIERLRAALAKYGDHTYECSMKDTVGQCTCGYSAELLANG